MNRNFLATMLITFILCSASNAQNYQPTESGIKATIKSVDVEIRFYGPATVRILKSPTGKTVTKESLSVIVAPRKTAFDTKQQGDVVSLKATGMRVDLNLKSGKITYYDAAGHTLLSEKEGGIKFTPFNDAGNDTYEVFQAFTLDKEEAIYGLGQQQNGNMIQRDEKLLLIPGNLDDGIPFFQSAKGYGIFWDNYSPTTFTDNADETSFSSEVGDCVDYYFMYGKNADGVIACMRELTGQVPMFPLWTYGFWQSKERYKSQDEIVNVVKRYRELGVPLDGIIQDWQYWGDNYQWNAMEFLNPEFPDPKKMVDDIHSMNAHIIISIWSSFGPKTKQYDVLDSKGMLFDFKTWPLSGIDAWPPDMSKPSGVRVYDPYHPEARKIYWNYLNKGLFSLGIDGWWMDSTEPDHMDYKPTDLDTKTYLGSFRKVRGAFPLMTVGGVSTNQRTVTSDKRVFILTRSAFAGQQRYGSNTWSGDVVSSWSALKKQISTGVNFSLCGIPYWNSDIGGFFLWEFPKKLEDPNYRELYVRWLQFGTFCPMMRSHGTDAPREIYQFGKKGDRVYDAIEKFIRLRYSLLPYLYSTAWDVTANQSSIMRGLMMDFPKDKNALSIDDEYMFGQSILVCPVTKAMYVKPVGAEKDKLFEDDLSTVKAKQVYLPQGNEWYDFWTGEKFASGKNIEKPTPLDIIPLYVKAGSIIPIGPDVQYATEKKWDDLEIRVYRGADGQFVLYEDENDSYNYEKGIYSTITFQWNNAKQQLTIEDRKGSFPGMLASRKFNIVLVDSNNGVGLNTNTKYSKTIPYNGKKVVVTLKNK